MNHQKPYVIDTKNSQNISYEFMCRRSLPFCIVESTVALIKEKVTRVIKHLFCSMSSGHFLTNPKMYNVGV